MHGRYALTPHQTVVVVAVKIEQFVGGCVGGLQLCVVVGELEGYVWNVGVLQFLLARSG